MQISYQAHVQDIGWQGWVSDGEMAGTEGQSRRIEAIRIRLLNAPQGAGVQYRAHVKGLRVEALEIRLTGGHPWSVIYRAHVQDLGWQEWVADGVTAGTTGQSWRIEALRVIVARRG
jgi:uncharacterized protein YjdB